MDGNAARVRYRCPQIQRRQTVTQRNRGISNGATGKDALGLPIAPRGPDWRMLKPRLGRPSVRMLTRPKRHGASPSSQPSTGRLAVLPPFVDTQSASPRRRGRMALRYHYPQKLSVDNPEQVV